METRLIPNWKAFLKILPYFWEGQFLKVKAFKGEALFGGIRKIRLEVWDYYFGPGRTNSGIGGWSIGWGGKLVTFFKKRRKRGLILGVNWRAYHLKVWRGG